jgi:hypothetical protein
MAEVRLSREALRAPAWMKLVALATVYSTLEAVLPNTVSAVRVESIVCDASGQRVNMDARIMPALTNVEMSFNV